MKKLILITFTLVSASFLFSCKKCQICTIKTVQNVSGFNQESSSTVEYCDEDYDSAPGNGSYNQKVDGIEENVTVTCVDN